VAARRRHPILPSRTDFAAGSAAKDQAPLTVRVRALTAEEGKRYFGGDGLRLGVQLGTQLRLPDSVEFLPWERPATLARHSPQPSPATTH
jgi:hypothetical protein